MKRKRPEYTKSEQEYKNEISVTENEFSVTEFDETSVTENETNKPIKRVYKKMFTRKTDTTL